MGVEVDEARGDGEPADVDLLATGALGDRSVEGHDAPAVDPDVAVSWAAHPIRRGASRCG